MQEDPDFFPTQNIKDVENVGTKYIKTYIREMEGTPASTDPMSALLVFRILDSMSLFLKEDGYFYGREHTRYV